MKINKKENRFIILRFISTKIIFFLVLNFNLQSQTFLDINNNNFFLPAFSAVNQNTEIHLSQTIHTFYKNNSFHSDLFYLSNYFSKIKSSFQIHYNSFSITEKIFRTSTFKISYSKLIELNDKNLLIFFISSNYITYSFNPNNIIFSSMIDQWEGIIRTNPNLQIKEKNKELNFDFGVSAKHNNFIISLFANNIYGIEQISSRQYNLFLAQNFNINTNLNIQTFLSSKIETQIFSGQIGSELRYKKLLIGISLKSIKTQKYFHSIISQIGYRNGWLEINYYFSYSNLQNNYCCINGITIKFKIRCKKNKINTINCPAY